MKQPKRTKTTIPFGQNLKALMKDRGLTHRQVAEMAGCPVSVINDWVGSGSSTPHDLTRVSRLASALGVSFQWLLLSEHPNINNITLADVFEEVVDDHLSGYFKVEVKKLKPKNTKE